MTDPGKFVSLSFWCDEQAVERWRREVPHMEAQLAGRARSFRVRLPLLWMVVFAFLLVGVVALNVAVLRANVSVNDLDKQIAQLQQGNANLASSNSFTVTVGL